VKEALIQKSIVDYVRAVCPDALVFAIPNAAPRGRSGKASNGVPGLLKGASDLCFVTHKCTLFAEVKTDKGRVSPEQRGFAMRAMSVGAHYAVWRSIDDVRATFKTLGIKTRESE
jgi:hypothetical protein